MGTKPVAEGASDDEGREADRKERSEGRRSHSIDALELEELERERHEQSMPPPLDRSGPFVPPARTMTFRQLLVWMEQWAKGHEDGELDMPVVMRLADDDHDEWMCGGLVSVEVDAGCTENEALVLDGSTDAEDA